MLGASFNLANTRIHEEYPGGSRPGTASRKPHAPALPHKRLRRQPSIICDGGPRGGRPDIGALPEHGRPIELGRFRAKALHNSIED